MFGLFHLNLFQFFYAFGLGLMFGYVYMRTSQLRYSIVMHMIINFNGSVLAPWGAITSGLGGARPPRTPLMRLRPRRC